MSGFEFARPAHLGEALDLLAEPGARAIAGGTDLVVDLRSRKIEPCRLVDISRLEELKGVRREGASLRVAGGATYREILGSEAVREGAPLLTAAARSVGSLQIRNMGTIGGNLATASPAGDMLPPLLVLEATVHIVSGEGERDVAAEEFFKGYRETALSPGELIREVRFEVPGGEEPYFFEKLALREAQAVSIVSIAFQGRRGGEGGLTRARVALGSVAPVPVRARGVEEALERDPSDIGGAAARVHESIAPVDDVRASGIYREEMAERLLEEGLRRAL